jgi:hypothetical protein
MTVFACHRDQAHLACHGGKEEILSVQDLDAVDVDQLPPQDILHQAQLALTALESGRVRVELAHHNRPGIEAQNIGYRLKYLAVPEL